MIQGINVQAINKMGLTDHVIIIKSPVVTSLHLMCKNIRYKNLLMNLQAI